jgi:hypothetical protein
MHYIARSVPSFLHGGRIQAGNRFAIRLRIEASPTSAVRGVRSRKIGHFTLKVGTTFRGSMVVAGGVRGA